MSAPKKRRRSSKKAPMSMAFVKRMLEQDGVETREEHPTPLVRLTVPLKPLKRKAGLGPLTRSFYMNMREVGPDSVWISGPQQIAVPKERISDAVRLLQRLHELR